MHARYWSETPYCMLYMLSHNDLVVATCKQNVTEQHKTAQGLSAAARAYLERAKDAVHGDKVQLHDSPLFLTQIALDLVQCAAHTDRQYDDMAVLACCCQQSLYQGKTHMAMQRLCKTGRSQSYKRAGPWTLSNTHMCFKAMYKPE